MLRYSNTLNSLIIYGAHAFWIFANVGVQLVVVTKVSCLLPDDEYHKCR